MDAFVQQNGFHIFSCLISGPHRAEKFRTTILGQRWRQIKLAEYSTAFPSAAATHFAATSPTEPNTYTEPHICRERQVDKRKKSILSHPWLLDARTKCLFQVAARGSPGSWVHEWCMTGRRPRGGVGGRWALVAKLGRVRAEDGWKENGGRRRRLQLAPPHHTRHTSPNHHTLPIHVHPCSSLVQGELSAKWLLKCPLSPFEAGLTPSFITHCIFRQ